MYTNEMLESIKKVEANREANAALEPRRMTAEEKDALLRAYHPDYKEGEEFVHLAVGPNKGDKVPKELGALLQGKSRISPEEIERVVEFVKQSGEAHYSDEVMAKIEESMQEKEKGGKGAAAAAPEAGEDEGDELLPAAVEVVLETGQASVSMLQRRLKLGYSRAARLVDQMEERGIVGPFEGSKPRQLLITRAQWQEMQMGGAPAPEADEPPFPTEEET